MLFISEKLSAFEVDGMYYRVIDSDQVEVTYRDLYHISGSYSGNIQIPETVTFDDVLYHVTSIGDLAFYECSGLTGSLSIPNSVTSIGRSAFRGCEGLTGDLTIPNSVTSIGEYAFWGCHGFTGTLTIPNSLTTIEEYVFAGCSGLTGTLTIPNSVTSIGDHAFWGCRGFTGSLTIPSSVTSIGYGAFQDCTGFNGSLTLSNSITTISGAVFYGCTGFTGSLIIPNSVTNIQWAAFFNCSGFTGTLNIPNSVNSIAEIAFAYCKGFSSLIIPNTITTIEERAFCECKGLTGSLTIPSSVTSIAYRAFEYCEGISSLTIPNSITNIGEGAFVSCKNLEQVNSNIVVPFSIGKSTFQSISSKAVLKIPKGTKQSYNQYENWICHFSKVLEEGEEEVTKYSLSISATGNGSATYYANDPIRDTTKSYTVNEGTSISVNFTADSGYRIKSLKVNGTSITASTSYTTTVNADTSIEVEFEAIPITTYTLSIKAIGNGFASYSGESIRGTTKSYTVNEGTSVTIKFSPDNGYRIKSLKVNGSSVTASTSYTTTINADTSLEVEFEAIPSTTYSLTIKAIGNGSASYSSETIRGKTKTFTVNEGTKVTISFSPDDGYQIKSIKVNNATVTVTSSYSATINSDTSLEVEFEAKPDVPKTYTLSIRAKGNGVATYNGETIRATTKSYTLEEGTKIALTFMPDEGNQIKSLRVNEEYITVTDSYETTINADISIKIDFEEIPLATYMLSIKAKGNGIASYGDETIRDNTSTFTLNEGTTGTIIFTPDEGYHIKSLKVNGSAIGIDTSYDFTMNSDTSVEVEFKVTIVEREFTIDGTNYEITSFEDHTVIMEAGDYGLILEVPEKVNYQDEEWTVTGIAEGALDQCEDLAAIIWNIEKPFNARIANPNLLLYVKNEAYAPSTIKNVVANGFAKAITLMDAQSGNNFYCPEAFIAQSIVYTHNYSMKSGMNESKGWETIALPFDVQIISHSSKGEIEPFANWTSGSSTKPFWLYELSGRGFVEAEAIKANTPYIISMPNNENYPNEYQLAGKVTFSALNAEVKKSDEVQTATFSNHTFIPSFINLENESGYYALNVNNEFENNQGSDNEGSKFILNLRRIHPFEAYMTSTSGTRSIDIFDGMTTGIKGIEEIVASEKVIKVYDLSGRLVKLGKTMESIKQELPSGVYIINNKKMIIK